MTKVGRKPGKMIATRMVELTPIALNPRSENLSGQRFGRWTVQNTFIRVGDVKHARIMWKCKCDCGNIDFIDPNQLKRGTSLSCGCYRKELQQQKAMTQ